MQAIFLLLSELCRVSLRCGKFHCPMDVLQRSAIPLLHQLHALFRNMYCGSAWAVLIETEHRSPATMAADQSLDGQQGASFS